VIDELTLQMATSGQTAARLYQRACEYRTLGQLERAERDFVAAGARTYLALLDGVVAGGGGLRITDGVAQLVGASTAPEHRRRGVQSALMTKRLADAAGAGCDIAVVTTAPGSKSQQNVQRQGFHLLYTRAVLVK
jgi:GNAT superfamily N-acetyltransferase